MRLLVLLAAVVAAASSAPAPSPPQGIRHYQRYYTPRQRAQMQRRQEMEQRSGGYGEVYVSGEADEEDPYIGDRGRGGYYRRYRQRGDQKDSAEEGASTARYNYGSTSARGGSSGRTYGSRRRRPGTLEYAQRGRGGYYDRRRYEEVEVDSYEDYDDYEESSEEEGGVSSGRNIFQVGLSPLDNAKFLDEYDGSSSEETEEVDGEGESGGNYLVHIGHRREDNGCPEGQVQDIYGYCR